MECVTQNDKWEPDSISIMSTARGANGYCSWISIGEIMNQDYGEGGIFRRSRVGSFLHRFAFLDRIYIKMPGAA